MPEYIVKTEKDRNIVIKAERYNLDKVDNSYKFWKDGRPVAEFPNNGSIFAIIEEEAEKADFYEHYDGNEDGVCDDCLFEKFVKSDAFINEVYSIIDSDRESNCRPNPETPAVEAPKEKYPIEKWATKDGKIWYGFHTKKGFVNFSQLSGAKSGRESQVKHPNGIWAYLDLTGATKLEENL